MNLESICGVELQRVGLAGKTAQQMWDSADKNTRKTWLARTGSWRDDAVLSWKELMAQGGSQAEVMKDYMEDLASGKKSDTLSALCDRELLEADEGDAGQMREKAAALARRYGGVRRAYKNSMEFRSAVRSMARMTGMDEREILRTLREDVGAMQDEQMSALCDRELARVGLAEEDGEALANELSALISKLQKAGHGREASQAGEIVGNWRRGRIGTSMIKAAIARTKSLLEE